MLKFQTKIMLCLFCLILSVNCANASLLVSPLRVTFSDRDRTDQIILINQGNDRRTYRLEWIEQTVDEKGKYIVLEESADFNHASDLIRFSPRQVTLNPGERQVIKLLLRKPANLKEGEYRSHLKFTAIPSDMDDSDTSGGAGISMKMHMFMSYSIPVLVKHGNEQPSVRIGNTFLTQKDGKYSLQTELFKDSKFGMSGEVLAIQQMENGEEKIVARLNNVNVFHEVNRRQVTLVMMNPEQPISGSLTLRYQGKYEYLGTTLAEKTTFIQ